MIIPFLCYLIFLSFSYNVSILEPGTSLSSHPNIFNIDANLFIDSENSTTKTVSVYLFITDKTSVY